MISDIQILRNSLIFNIISFVGDHLLVRRVLAHYDVRCLTERVDDWSTGTSFGALQTSFRTRLRFSRFVPVQTLGHITHTAHVTAQLGICHNTIASYIIVIIIIYNNTYNILENLGVFHVFGKKNPIHFNMHYQKCMNRGKSTIYTSKL